MVVCVVVYPQAKSSAGHDSSQKEAEDAEDEKEAKEAADAYVSAQQPCCYFCLLFVCVCVSCRAPADGAPAEAAAAVVVPDEVDADLEAEIAAQMGSVSGPKGAMTEEELK